MTGLQILGAKVHISKRYNLGPEIDSDTVPTIFLRLVGIR